MEEEVYQNQRLLKIIVITLGVLIIIMLAIMVGTVIMRLNSGEDTGDTAPAPASAGLSVPAGSQLVELMPTDRELYLHVRDAAGDDHIYVLDRKSGALLWHRQLEPAE